MRVHIRLAAIMLVAVPVGVSGQSAEIEPAAIIAPVTEAIAKEQARQSQLPPPASIREQLERMGRLDQAGRWAIGDVDFSRLTIEEGRRVHEALGAAINPIDDANVAALLEIMPEEGWFSISEVGEQASAAAFHIVQHSDLDLQKRVLPRIEPLVASGEIAGDDYASMFDRIAVSENRPQRYGTQFRCVQGKLESYPIENINQVEDLRRPLNFPESLADAQKRHVGRPCGGRN
jgi:hypothetical protein